MSVTWSKEAQQQARQDRAYLVKLTINGRYAEQGPSPGGSVGVSGVVSSEDALVAMALLHHLTFPGSPLPTPYREATLAALAAMLRTQHQQTPEDLAVLVKLLMSPPALDSPPSAGG